MSSNVAKNLLQNLNTLQSEEEDDKIKEKPQSIIREKTL